MSRYDFRLSVFPSAYRTVPCELLTLSHVIDRISNGFYREEVHKVRESLLDKRALPAVTFSGQFTQRNAWGLTEPSGWLALDLDQKDNLNIDLVKGLHGALRTDPHVGAVFKSARGNGLKIIVAIDPTKHVQSAIAAADYFHTLYGVTIDLSSSKDIPRLCFVSYDPEAWIKEGAIELPVPNTTTNPQRTPSSDPKFETEEGELAAIAEVEAVLACIPTRPKYPTWLMILSGVFTKLPFAHAVALLNAWSPEESEDEYEKKFPYRLREVGFEYALKLASEGGYDRGAAALARLPDLQGSMEDQPTPPGPERSEVPSLTKLVHFPSDITEAGGVNDFVEGLLTDRAMSVVYGQSNVGKSFWAFDLGAHVARGTTWRNNEVGVKGGAVLYFALEGAHGARGRVVALKKQGLLSDDDPFGLCFCPVNLLNDKGAALICAAIKEVQDRKRIHVRLVIIDTLSRSMGGGNENDNDMMKAVLAVDAVRSVTRAHIMLIHHSGKDEAKGARGHSSLRASTDTEIELYRPEGEEIITAIVRKQRDLEPRLPMPFRLEKVEIGVGGWGAGKPLTSCVCVHLRPEEALDRASAAGGGRGRSPKVPVHQLLGLLPQPSIAAWRKECEKQFGVSKSSFYTQSAGLREGGRYAVDAEGGVALVGDVFGFNGGTEAVGDDPTA